jgi:hypothetical protein
MYRMSNLNDIEKLCNEIMNSVYFRKQTPIELAQLRIVLDKIDMLIKQGLPPLFTEVKQLRNQNKRLLAEIEALHASIPPVHEEVPADVPA